MKEEEGDARIFHFKANNSYVQSEENAGGQGSEESLQVTKKSRGGLKAGATPGIKPLFVVLENMTAKPREGERSKKCIPWKVENAVYNFVHTERNNKKVTTESSAWES